MIPELFISAWYGRLGNNIQQLGNALMLAELCHIPAIVSIPHPQLGSLTLETSATCANRLITNSSVRSDFFHWDSQKPDRSILIPYSYIAANMARVLQKYLLPHLLPFLSNVSPPGEEVVLHIRAGDIFSKPPGATWDNNYIPNPLEYYRALISEFHTIRIVTEASWPSNPVILSLLQIYPHIQVQSSDVLTDFLTLAQAKRIISSGVGTFAVAAAMLNSDLETFFYSELFLHEHVNPSFLRHDSCKCCCIKLKDYRLKSEGWLNTPNQHQYLLDYQLSL